MGRAHTQLYDTEAGRAIDAAAIAQMPVAGFELMLRAARFGFDVLLDAFPEASRVRILCGKGNNGGDGYALAALAAEAGLTARVTALAAPEQLVGDARLAWERCVAAGVSIEVWADAEPDALRAHLLERCDVWVDALLGTGVSRAVVGNFALAIEALNGVDVPVLSLDIPSGIDADTGAVAGIAVRAALTTAFITRKIGHYTGPGLDYLGAYRFSDLGVGDACYRDGVSLMSFAASSLPGLSRNAYKHQRGRLAIVGSDVGMPGACAMAAEAALRCGAGLVSVHTHLEHGAALIARTPEVMIAAAPETDISAARYDVVVLGPGLGRGDFGSRCYRQVEASGLPVVLDADGLYFLADAGAWQGGPLFVTPHSGEAARLLNCDSAAIADDRIAAALRISRQYGCSGVLKGAGSVVFGPAVEQAESLAICGHGNPGMASAGMGDVLAGVAGGLLAGAYARSAGPEDVQTCFAQAVALHSAAADRAVRDTGQISLLATDVLAQLPELLKAVG
ncbi:MAG: NAD(P)H-hydrate dehydratase [Pseudomonadota bacterium]